MAKLTLDPVGNFNSTGLTTINSNSDKIEAALEKTLSRDGTVPNQMEADLDLNHNDVLNVDNLTASTLDTDILYVDGSRLIPGEPVTDFDEFFDLVSIDEDDMVSDTAARLPTQQSVKAYVDSKIVKDRTELADSGSYTEVVFVKDISDEHHYKWDGSDLSAEVAADVAAHPDWNYYVPPTGGDGSTGAFALAGAIPTGGHWTDTGTAPRIFPMAGRVFIGRDAQDAWKGYSWGNPSPASWITGVTDELRYIEKGAQLVVMNDVGGPSALFASRMSDNDYTSAGPYTAGAGFFVYNNAAGSGTPQTTLTHRGAWGRYTEAWRVEGAGPAIGSEIESVNLGSEATFYTPYGVRDDGVATNTRTLALGLGIGAGAGQGGNPDITMYDSTAAIYITGNGAKFRSGMTFVNGSLTDRGTNLFHAVEFAQHHRQVWFYGSGANAKALQIYASGNDASKQSIVEASIAGLRIKTVRDDLTTETLPGLSVVWPTLTGSQDINGLSIQPAASGSSAPVVLAAAGTDTNSGIVLRPKGTAAVTLQDQSGNARFTVNATGIGYFGTTPIAPKTGWSVDTGTAKRTANATYSGTAEASYTQATIQTLMDAVRDLSQTVKALKDDLHQTAGYGLLRT